MMDLLARFSGRRDLVVDVSAKTMQDAKHVGSCQSLSAFWNAESMKAALQKPFQGLLRFTQDKYTARKAF